MKNGVMNGRNTNKKTKQKMNKKHNERKEGSDRGEEIHTLKVVSSEEVISVWPFWLNWQCSTVLVCPSRVARSFPEGISNTWKKKKNFELQIFK